MEIETNCTWGDDEIDILLPILWLCSGFCQWINYTELLNNSNLISTMWMT